MASEEVTVNSSSRYRLPSNSTMQHAAKFAIMDDRPIMLDYWADSLDKEIIIGKYDNGEKILVRATDEYTSPIKKMFQCSGEWIILTENSIYIVDKEIESRMIGNSNEQ